jgi:hypothetical protein|tara:strand:- start:116 stop:355 length:240 start_codon:yes stop_codon:yes gene_type:complete
MPRPLSSLLLLVLLGVGGCGLNVDNIKEGAEEIQKEADEIEQQINSSNLKDCQDEKGNPLPKWVCSKDETDPKKSDKDS